MPRVSEQFLARANSSHGSPDPAEMSRVAVRKAQPGDAECVASLFRIAYRLSSHPCQRSEFVTGALARGDFWYLAVVEDRIVACQGMTFHHWNRSWEFSRGVT